MSARQINCSGCGCNLGEIRDAKLRKDIRYLCADCEDERKAAITHTRNSKFNESDPLRRMFGDWLK